MAVQPNILAAVRRALPSVPREIDFGIIDVIKMGSDTAAFKPLKIWEDARIDYWRWADAGLVELMRRKDMQAQRMLEVVSSGHEPDSNETSLLQKWPPAPTTSTLHNEADVSHVSTSVLTDQISMLLKVLVPDLQIRHRFEKQVGSSKRDLLWEYRIPGKAGDGDNSFQEFAILEYKKTNVIHPEQFEKGHIGLVMSSEKNNTIATKEELLSDALKDPEFTLLVDNARALTQQALKYSERAQHILCFDWDTMAVFDFTERDPNTAGIFFHREDQQSVAQGRTFRYLLLGFLLNALYHTTALNGIRLRSL